VPLAAPTPTTPAARRERVQHARELRTTDQFQQQVHPLTRGEFADAGHQVLLTVPDNLVRAEVEELPGRLRAGRRRDDRRTGAVGELHRGHADSSGRTPDKYRRTRFQQPRGEQRLVGGAEGDGQGGRLLQADRLGNRVDVVGRHHPLCGV
jgi:hypothetical protein